MLSLCQRVLLVAHSLLLPGSSIMSHLEKKRERGLEAREREVEVEIETENMGDMT